MSTVQYLLSRRFSRTREQLLVWMSGWNGERKRGRGRGGGGGEGGPAMDGGGVSGGGVVV